LQKLQQNNNDDRSFAKSEHARRHAVTSLANKLGKQQQQQASKQAAKLCIKLTPFYIQACPHRSAR
jgi:hypothetical protein